LHNHAGNSLRIACIIDDFLQLDFCLASSRISLSQVWEKAFCSMYNVTMDNIT
jgi:hypothetical protein